MDASQTKTLVQELRMCLRQINSQIEEIRQEAVRTSIPPVTMRDERGTYIWASLVIAKANVLHSLTLLNQGTFENDNLS